MFMINSGHNTLSQHLGLSSILALNTNMKRTPFSTESQLILFHPAITSNTIVVILRHFSPSKLMIYRHPIKTFPRLHLAMTEIL